MVNRPSSIVNKPMLRNLLRFRLITSLIGWIFTHMSFLIPAKRLRETPNLIAFQHPSPSYKVHLLLVPKRQVQTLADLDPNDAAFLTDLYATVQSLVKEFDLKDYRLIVNGGEFQDFPHLHFHLISDL